MPPLRRPFHYKNVQVEESSSALDLSKRIENLEVVDGSQSRIASVSDDHEVPREQSPQSQDLNYDGRSSCEPSPSQRSADSPNAYPSSSSMYNSSGSEGRRSPYMYPSPEQFRQLQIQREQVMMDRNMIQVAEIEALAEMGIECGRVPAIDRIVKLPRPFKAYPSDPLTLTKGFNNINRTMETSANGRFEAFRESMLRQIRDANGGQATVSNPRMRRTVNNNTRPMSKDISYTERRKKNNEAAKKSRDRRRIKEDEIAIRASFLESDNYQLRLQLSAAQRQLESAGIPFPRMDFN